ncbi:MAG TPA: ATP-binding protein [Paludibacter sp.]
MQFRTKARAVDLLGKGQIADLPTAITELWKNGYDAYADHLTAEIYLKGFKDIKSSWFVITDDGKGMSRKDIFDKWLVLGTDSKSRGILEDFESEDTLWKKPRIKAGEKGIGRLSVAYLGSPMLMFTKKRGYPLQAMFFDWRLLENFNLFLDDIEIPVEDIDELSEFRTKFEILKTSFLNNLEKHKDVDGNLIWEKSQENLRNEIVFSVNSIKLPTFFEKEFISDMVNLLDDNGTKFIVFEPEDQILNLIDSGSDSNVDDTNDSNSVRSSLVGFTNVFKKEEDSLPITTKFPIHKEFGWDYDYLRSAGSFFKNKDFDFADVVIDGEFDGQGKFDGKLIIYNEPIQYSFISPRKRDSRNDYGSFKIKLGYSQGEESDSKLEEVQYKRINEKVKNYGGLYLYRDNFRILPYGRASADFLGFEERRNKRIGTAFFSYRRMFGYIGLTRNTNYKLKDKSSREGLINNASYRVFVFDLISFFKGLSQDFFGDKAKKSIFLDQKKKINEQSEAIKNDKNREKYEKIAFTKSLKDYPVKFENYQNEYQDLLNKLDKKISDVNVAYSDIETLLAKINRLDIEYKNLLPDIPKRYKPTDTQLDRLALYENKLIDFNGSIKINSERLMSKVQAKLAIQELKKEFVKNYQQFNFELERILNCNKQILQEKTKSIINEFDTRAANILSELRRQKDQAVLIINTRESVISEIDKIKSKFELLREQCKKELTPLVTHIKRLDFNIDEELLQGAYKEEYETIKYKWEQTRETSQLGIAVEIIDHEFNVLYSQINTSLENLENKFVGESEAHFRQLKRLFESLEDKYDLLSPLYRIAGVVPKEIKCESIFEYLLRFFENKLKNDNIKLKQSSSFKNHILIIKEPVIHTVFINVINNAIYWLRNSERKVIILDYLSESNEILIKNSGQLIEKYKLDKIFELFYSNRPNGRGIGLYLSKQTLVENNYDIFATNDENYNTLNGACFVIRPLK